MSFVHSEPNPAILLMRKAPKARNSGTQGREWMWYAFGVFSIQSAGRIRFVMFYSQHSQRSCLPHQQYHYKHVAAAHSENERGRYAGRVFSHQSVRECRLLVYRTDGANQFRPKNH